MPEIRDLLVGIGQRLNDIRIPARIGNHRLSLSTRSVSDLIEKYCIDILMSDTPGLVHSAGAGKAYDVVIDTEPLTSINIKTELRGQYRYDAIWLCSESVLRRAPESLKDTLYYLRLEYTVNDLVTINQVSYAGPLTALAMNEKLIIYDKTSGRMTQADREVDFRIARHYNGKHVHLLTDAFVNV
jgi:hypothetical protein